MANRLRVGLGKTGGFTIVELIMVIVIISILASITLVAYGGVQDRSKNTAIIDAASSVVKMVQVYASTNAAYPTTVSTAVCVTTASGCDTYGTATGGDTTFDTNMATVGNVPRSVPIAINSTLNGIFYYYNATRTMDSKVQPVYVVYQLKGASQQCGVPGVSADTTMVTTTSTTGYTANSTWSGIPITVCYVSVPGPTS